MKMVSELLAQMELDLFKLQIVAAKNRAHRERMNNGPRWRAVKKLYRLHRRGFFTLQISRNQVNLTKKEILCMWFWKHHKIFSKEPRNFIPDYISL